MPSVVCTAETFQDRRFPPRKLVAPANVSRRETTFEVSHWDKSPSKAAAPAKVLTIDATWLVFHCEMSRLNPAAIRLRRASNALSKLVS